MKIGVMGAGGQGGYIGGRLAHAGHVVAFIARGEHLKAMRESGLRVESPKGDFIIESPNATDDPREVGTVDLILFSVKTYDALEAIEQMKPMVGPQTVVLPVLNGVEHIEQLGDRLGYDHVLGGKSEIVAHIAEPGLIRNHVTWSPLEFGELDRGISERCQSIQSALTQTDIIEFKAVPNVLESMWSKYAGACATGLTTVVRASWRLVYGCPETLELYWTAGMEAVAVAGAKGISCPVPTFDEFLELSKNFPPDWKPSMLLDLENGRRLELEAWSGALSRMGKELGVPTPVNDFVYACLKPYVNGQPEG